MLRHLRQFLVELLILEEARDEVKCILGLIVRNLHNYIW